jgi:hypothetical protein
VPASHTERLAATTERQNQLPTVAHNPRAIYLTVFGEPEFSKQRAEPDVCSSKEMEMLHNQVDDIFHMLHDQVVPVHSTLQPV